MWGYPPFQSLQKCGPILSSLYRDPWKVLETLCRLCNQHPGEHWYACWIAWNYGLHPIRQVGIHYGKPGYYRLFASVIDVRLRWRWCGSRMRDVVRYNVQKWYHCSNDRWIPLDQALARYARCQTRGWRDGSVNFEYFLQVLVLWANEGASIGWHPNCLNRFRTFVRQESKHQSACQCHPRLRASTRWELETRDQDKEVLQP